MKRRKDIYKDSLVKVDILDVLLDENNTSNIVMKGDKGETLEMEQIAVIPYDENDLYAILKPVTKTDGFVESDAIVYKVEINFNGQGVLKVEEDEDKARGIFKEYYRLFYDGHPNADETFMNIASELIMAKKYKDAKVIYEVLAEAGNKDAESSLVAINRIAGDNKK